MHALTAVGPSSVTVELLPPGEGHPPPYVGKWGLFFKLLSHFLQTTPYVAYFPAGPPPQAAKVTLYEPSAKGTKRLRSGFMLIAEQGTLSYVGRSYGEDYQPGPQACK